jgi:8-oxo-dGTP pyrophosphatase MutT (NUDIX family)
MRRVWFILGFGREPSISGFDMVKVVKMGMKDEDVFAVTIVIFNESGKILTVSRKHDYNDVNLPGGKVDPEDETLRDAIAREVFEETGFRLGRRPIEEVYRAEDCEGHLCATFIYRGNITAEWVAEGLREGEGFVRWSDYDDICADTSTYREYNLELKAALRSRDLL